MWRQEMLPSILHGCHFEAISSFSIKILSLIFLNRPRIIRATAKGMGLRVERTEKTFICTKCDVACEECDVCLLLLMY
jgi:hypothetical protein